MSRKFKETLAYIKNDFEMKLSAQNKQTMSTEEAAILIQKYYNGSLTTINNILMKSTGKTKISWDHVLQYLEEQLNVEQSVKKIEHNNNSATEIHQLYESKYSKLLNYVKSKETNNIQQIISASQEICPNLYIVIMSKEIVFYDIEEKDIISTIHFNYTKSKKKIDSKEDHKRSQKMNDDQLKLQKSDKVTPMDNPIFSQHLGVSEVMDDKRKSRRLTPKMNFLTNNLKNSVRGSQISSEKSNEKVFFRRLYTDVGDAKKRQKSPSIKIKNDDVRRVFQIFDNSKLEHSISIAHAFVEARSNFQKNIILDKQLLSQEPKQFNLQLSSAKVFHNYEREIEEMRQTNKRLSDNGLKRKPMSASMDLDVRRKNNIREIVSSKDKRDIRPSGLQSKMLEIVNTSALDSYLLISLFNREVRLYKLKRVLLKIKEELIFEKHYHQIATYVLLYRNVNNCCYGMAIYLEGPNDSTIKIYSLDLEMRVKNNTFNYDLNYFAICQEVLPYGLALFNELGRFTLIQLNNNFNQSSEKICLDAHLNNKERNSRVNISRVRMHRDLISFYFSCSHGYLYLYDRLSQGFKYQQKINQSSILDFYLIKGQKEILSILKNGNMMICSATNLEKIFMYQSYRQILSESRLFISEETKFSIVTGRTVSSFYISENEDKKFNSQKPIKILKSRLKLKKLEKTGESKQDRRTKINIFKVIEGHNNNQKYFILLAEHGEVMVFNQKIEYAGSYHFINIATISDICCNQHFQFISILFDNNHVQVVNLYTQANCFTILNYEPHPTAIKTKQQSHFSSAFSKKNESKSNKSDSISLMYFYYDENQPSFLVLMTQNYEMKHYNAKGLLLFVIELLNLYNDLNKSTSFLFQKGELLCTRRDGELAVFHKKSYLRKNVIKVSKHSLVKVKVSEQKHQTSTTYIMDNHSQVFIVNLQTKYVQKLLIHESENTIYQFSIFNDFYLIKTKGTLKITVLNSNVEFEEEKLQIEKYYFLVVCQKIIAIAKISGKMLGYNLEKHSFEEINY